MAFAAIGKDAVREFDVLWITAGWGCVGDTIAMTAAPRPASKMSSLGQVPWIPKINLHNPFLALAIGDDFLRPFHMPRKALEYRRRTTLPNLVGFDSIGCVFHPRDWSVGLQHLVDFPFDSLLTFLRRAAFP